MNGCQHENTTYKVMDEETNDPWIALICDECGETIEEVRSLMVIPDLPAVMIIQEHPRYIN